MDNLKHALMKIESRWNWALLPKSHHEQVSTMCRFCTTVLLLILLNCVYWSVSISLSVKTPIQVIRCRVNFQEIWIYAKKWTAFFWYIGSAFPFTFNPPYHINNLDPRLLSWYRWTEQLDQMIIVDLLQKEPFYSIFIEKKTLPTKVISFQSCGKKLP